MRYLRRDEPPPAKDSLRALASAAGVTAADIVVEQHLHRMIVTGGMPTIDNGGLTGRPGTVVGAGVFVAGDWVGPTGMLVDAAMASGEAAGAAAARLASRRQVDA